ncbi:hypothetical protein PR048_030904 [Dryococelus australis]|uniref:Uncharacterized protein n=1 Tax=Dryococelus australis TaxID=614101 RepID=A0ABQ9GA72_9NEOP|nr:hypothetical protein PR048_030904 [Dryococelus australis]
MNCERSECCDPTPACLYSPGCLPEQAPRMQMILADRCWLHIFGARPTLNVSATRKRSASGVETFSLLLTARSYEARMEQCQNALSRKLHQRGNAPHSLRVRIFFLVDPLNDSENASSIAERADALKQCAPRIVWLRIHCFKLKRQRFVFPEHIAVLRACSDRLNFRGNGTHAKLVCAASLWPDVILRLLTMADKELALNTIIQSVLQVNGDITATKVTQRLALNIILSACLCNEYVAPLVGHAALPFLSHPLFVSSLAPGTSKTATRAMFDSKSVKKPQTDYNRVGNKNVEVCHRLPNFVAKLPADCPEHRAIFHLRLLTTILKRCSSSTIGISLRLVQTELNRIRPARLLELRRTSEPAVWSVCAKTSEDDEPAERREWPAGVKSATASISTVKGETGCQCCPFLMWLFAIACEGRIVGITLPRIAEFRNRVLTRCVCPPTILREECGGGSTRKTSKINTARNVTPAAKDYVGKDIPLGSRYNRKRPSSATDISFSGRPVEGMKNVGDVAYLVGMSSLREYCRAKSTELRRNDRAEETGHPRENPPTSGIRGCSHLEIGGFTMDATVYRLDSKSVKIVETDYDLCSKSDQKTSPKLAFELCCSVFEIRHFLLYQTTERVPMIRAAAERRACECRPYGWLSSEPETRHQAPIGGTLHAPRERHCTQVERLARRGDKALDARVSVALMAGFLPSLKRCRPYGWLSSEPETRHQAPIGGTLHAPRERHCTQVVQLARRGDGALDARVSVALMAGFLPSLKRCRPYGWLSSEPETRHQAPIGGTLHAPRERHCTQVVQLARRGDGALDARAAPSTLHGSDTARVVQLAHSRKELNTASPTYNLRLTLMPYPGFEPRGSHTPGSVARQPTAPREVSVERFCRLFNLEDRHQHYTCTQAGILRLLVGSVCMRIHSLFAESNYFGTDWLADTYDASHVGCLPNRKPGYATQLNRKFIFVGRGRGCRGRKKKCCEPNLAISAIERTGRRTTEKEEGGNPFAENTFNLINPARIDYSLMSERKIRVIIWHQSELHSSIHTGAGVVFHWLLHRCKATPILAELHVIGAHNCEVFIYWRRVTQDVQDKSASPLKEAPWAMRVTERGNDEVQSIVTTKTAREIGAYSREVFIIGAELPRPCQVNNDPMANVLQRRSGSCIGQSHWAPNHKARHCAPIPSDAPWTVGTCNLIKGWLAGPLTALWDAVALRQCRLSSLWGSERTVNNLPAMSLKAGLTRQPCITVIFNYFVDWRLERRQSYIEKDVIYENCNPFQLFGMLHDGATGKLEPLLGYFAIRDGKGRSTLEQCVVPGGARVTDNLPRQRSVLEDTSLQRAMLSLRTNSKLHTPVASFRVAGSNRRSDVRHWTSSHATLPAGLRTNSKLHTPVASFRVAGSNRRRTMEPSLGPSYVSLTCVIGPPLMLHSPQVSGPIVSYTLSTLVASFRVAGSKRRVREFGRLCDIKRQVCEEKRRVTAGMKSATASIGRVKVFEPRTSSTAGWRRTNRLHYGKLAYARLHHRCSKLDPRSDLRSTQKTVAPFEFRAGLEIELKFVWNRRNRRFEISIQDQQPSVNHANFRVIKQHSSRSSHIDRETLACASEICYGFCPRSMFKLPCIQLPIFTIGAAVAERLARSPPTKANRAPIPGRVTGFSLVGIVPDDTLVGGFSRGSPASPAPSFLRCSILTSIALIGSQDLAAEVGQISSLTVSQRIKLCAEYQQGVSHGNLLSPTDRQDHQQSCDVLVQLCIAAMPSGIGVEIFGGWLLTSRSRKPRRVKRGEYGAAQGFKGGGNGRYRRKLAD